MFNAYTPPAGTPVAPKTPYASDPALQEIYARAYTALKSKRLAVYGDLFDEQEADVLATQAVQSILALPESVTLQTKARAVLGPFVEEQARIGASKATSKLLVGGMAAVLFAGAMLTLISVVQKG